MNNQQGRPGEKNKNQAQRRSSDKPNERQKKSHGTAEKHGVPDGQQHGGSGRGMNRSDAEAGTGDEQNEARGKPFGNVRESENQRSGADEQSAGNAANKSKDTSKTAAGAEGGTPADEDSVDEDEEEGDTSTSKKQN